MPTEDEMDLSEGTSDPSNDKGEKKKIHKKAILFKDHEYMEQMESEEKIWMKKNLKSNEDLEEMEVRCTSCYNQVNHKLSSMIARHPILGVVICKPCKKNYFDGVWTRDEDGFFEHCRWCANGGELLCCANESCKNSFCRKCIKRNLGRTAASNIQDDDKWQCLTCDVKQIREGRLLFYSIYTYWEDQKKKDDEREKRRKMNQLRSEDSISKTIKEALYLNRTFKRELDIQKVAWNKQLLQGDEKSVNSIQSAKGVLEVLNKMESNLKSLGSKMLEDIKGDNPNINVKELLDEVSSVAAKKEEISQNGDMKLCTESEDSQMEMETSGSPKISPRSSPKISPRKSPKPGPKCSKSKVEINGLDDSDNRYEQIKSEVLNSSSEEDENEESVTSSKNKSEMEDVKNNDSFKPLSGEKTQDCNSEVQRKDEDQFFASEDDDDNLGLGTDSATSDLEEQDKDFEIEKMDKKRVKRSYTTEINKRYRQHIGRIDVSRDKKLHSESVVVVNSICKEVLQELEIMNNTIRVSDFKKYLKTSRKTKSDQVKFDEEINRLCSLKTLERKPRASKSKSYVKKAKAERNLDSASSVENSVNEASSSDEDDFKPRSSRNLQSLSEKDLAKASVLASSSEEEEGSNEASSSDDEIEEGKGKKKGGNGKKEKRISKKSKRKRREDPSFMKVKLSESEDEDGKTRKTKRAASKAIKDGSEGSDSDEIQNAKGKKGNKRKKKQIMSDSEFEVSDNQEDCDDGHEISDENENEDMDSNSDSDIQPKKKRSKRKKGNSDTSDNSDASDEEPRPKKKRKRIKHNSSSEGEEEENTSSPTKGRKDIRKIKKVSTSTKEAATEEKERRKRMDERQQLYNETFKIKEGETLKNLVLDFDSKSKDVLVEVEKKIVKKLKPHQANGIKFMWDAVFESKKDVKNDRIPGGAILAHCMGLGKTLQTIGLVHTVHAQFPSKVAKVLVLCPVNTIKNWVDEFDKWLKGDLEIDVYELSNEKDNWGRSDRLAMWAREGGVMIMGYDMFRNLTNETTKKFKKKQRETFQSTLVDPGPDLVVCDEGHVLKNLKSALNIAMNKIKTKRRIILTGTPLQNNLTEYFAMVNFVKPKLLGTFGEFKNRFVNPIQNGQHSDSTERDVRVMKKRSFILNDLLKGCMQRLDYNVLVPYLQPKHEYVLCINLTEFQKKLYCYYLENYARAGQIGAEGKLEGGKKGGLFYDCQNLSRVWNHPYILRMAKNRADIKAMFVDDDEEGSIKDFIDDADATDRSTSSDEEKSDSDNPELIEEDIVAPSKKTTRSQVKNKDELIGGLEEAKEDTLSQDKGWWHQFLEKDEELEKVELGSKMVLLIDILRECELLGDKVLVFSQSLLSLDLIEAFLEQIDAHGYPKDSNKSSEDSEDPISYYGSWKHGRDYYRMDGSTPPDTRKRWCNYFNKATNHQTRLFLISTKAGGLGINLCAANRVIIFDASWNPAHDVQSIFRVYRFGQEKPVYIYRFLAKGTMEEKIYDRQVTKQSLSARVVDEHQIERHFSMNELSELYEFKDEPQSERPLPKVPKDRLLAELLKKHETLIWKFHDHDSLLENQVDENLTEDERKLAWEEFENEKKGFVNMGNPLMQQALVSNVNPQLIQDEYRRQYPHLTDEQIVHATRAFILQIQSGIHRRPAYDKSHYQQEMAKAKAQEQMMYPNRFQQQPQSSQQTSSSESLYQMKALEQQRRLQEAQKLAQVQQYQMVHNRHAMAQDLGARMRQIQSEQRIRQYQAKRQPELVTLEDGIDDEVITLDGEAVYESVNSDPTETITISPPRTSSRPGVRRGRPRLDPDTDDYFGGQEQ